MSSAAWLQYNRKFQHADWKVFKKFTYVIAFASAFDSKWLKVTQSHTRRPDFLHCASVTFSATPGVLLAYV